MSSSNRISKLGVRVSTREFNYSRVRVLASNRVILSKRVISRNKIELKQFVFNIHAKRFIIKTILDACSEDDAIFKKSRIFL